MILNKKVRLLVTAVSFLLIIFTFQNCTQLSSSSSTESASLNSFSENCDSSQLFGYYGSAMTGIGSGNYIEQVKNISNVVIIGSTDPDLVEKISQARQSGLKVIFSMRWSFWGADGLIRDDYKSQWQIFKNKLKGFENLVAAIYLADEPYWIYYSAHTNPSTRHLEWVQQSLQTLSEMVKTDWPWAKTAFVEAYPILEQNLYLPVANVDWIGFDCYEGFEHCGQTSILSLIAKMKSYRTGQQKLIAVPQVGKPASSSTTEAQMIQWYRLWQNEWRNNSDYALVLPFIWSDFNDGHAPAWKGLESFPNLLKEASCLK